MYTSFYHLEKKPFQISSDPRFLWLGEKHKEALAILEYGILDSKGFLLLTGDVGTGKTTLIHSLIEKLSNDVIFASVPDPSLPKLDFFNYIALEFGIDKVFESKGEFLVGFRKFLLKAHEDEKKVLLIIDEAQLLTQELLEEIRLLSNIEKTHTKLINIFFVGQNEFNESLNRPQNRAVRQRLTLNYHIDPLTPDETDEYINYRLKIAGAAQEIFEPAAVQEIFMYSGGFPRRINVICDHALLSGYVQDAPTIDVNIVKECAKDLKIPIYGSDRAVDGFGAYQTPNTSPEFRDKPVHRPVSPGPVIIQPAVPEKQEGRGAGTIAVWAAGLAIIAGLVFFLFFSGYFPALTMDIGPLKSELTTFISDKKILVKQMPAPSPLPAPSPAVVQTSPESEDYGGTQKQSGDPAVPVEKPPDASKTLTANDDPATGSGADPAKDESQKIVIQALKPPVVITPEPSENQQPTVEPPPPLPDGKIIVRFKYDTNEFTRQGLVILQEFADILARHPDARIKVSGYSDSAGYPKYNERLSKFRANIVRGFLLGRGADPDQFEVYGLGSKNPVESNDTAWGRMMNRRVEIEVIR